MRKVTVSRMRERYAQTVLTFPITYVFRWVADCSEVVRRSQVIKFCVIEASYVLAESGV